MRLNRLSAAAVLAAALLTLPALAEDKAAPKDLGIMYAKIERAFLKRDISAFMAVTTPTFTSKSGDKVTEGRMFAAQIGMQFAMLERMTACTMRIEKLSVKGKTAVVTNRYMYKGIVVPQPGKKVVLAMKGVSRDTWTKGAQGWRMQQLEIQNSATTADGKPMGGKSK